MQCYHQPADNKLLVLLITLTSSTKKCINHCYIKLNATNKCKPENATFEESMLAEISLTKNYLVDLLDHVISFYPMFNEF